MEHPAREVVGTRHREVPRELEVGAPDPGFTERLERALHARTPRLEPPVGRRPTVAIGSKGGRDLQRIARLIDHLPEPDYVPVAFPEVDGGPQHERPLGVRLGVRVHLRPERVALTGVGVDDHDR